jgi:hypothetical protein
VGRRTDGEHRQSGGDEAEDAEHEGAGPRVTHMDSRRV